MEARDPFIGTILDRRYRIEERIAAGGFGAIYRAVHVRSEMQLAIKVLHPRLSADERIVARFRREGATLTNLRSPHTVTTYELAEDTNGQLFIVMELLRGQTLLDRFQAGGALPWRRVVAIARAVCDALAEAHALGVVHRDLKPANIHLSERDGVEDYVKVLDFGIAKLLRGSGIEEGGEELTNHNEVIGTFEYISPEQIAGDSYSGRSDIYTLGVVMYEMVTGTRPFGNLTGPALMATIFSDVPKPPSTKMPGLPPELDALILRCLERDPDARWPSVLELGTALDSLVAERDLSGESATAIGAPIDPSIADDATSVTRRPSWSSSRGEGVTDSDATRTVPKKPSHEGPTAPGIGDSIDTPMLAERTTSPRGSSAAIKRSPEETPGPEQLTVRRVPPPPTAPPPIAGAPMHTPPQRPSFMPQQPPLLPPRMPQTPGQQPPHRPSAPPGASGNTPVPMGYPAPPPAPLALGLPSTYGLPGQQGFAGTPRASQPVINPSARPSLGPGMGGLGASPVATTAPGLGVAPHPGMQRGQAPPPLAGPDQLANVFNTLEGWQAPAGPPPPQHREEASRGPGALLIWGAVLAVAILIGVILAVWV